MFLITDFNNSFTLQSEMISTHIWNKNLPPHLNCVRALSDKHWAVNIDISYIFYTKEYTVFQLSSYAKQLVIYDSHYQRIHTVGSKWPPFARTLDAFTPLINSRTVFIMLWSGLPELNRPLFQFTNAIGPTCLYVNTLVHGRLSLRVNWIWGLGCSQASDRAE